MRRSPRPAGGSKKSMKKSDIMAEEAARMEARLQVLRAQMDSDKAKTAAPAASGSRWRSSRLDRGGISKYADDVKDRAAKPRTRRPKESAAAAPAPRSARRPSTGGRNRLKMDQADKWGVADVSRWLQMMGLDKYKDVFAENEINGEVLLQIQRDDLDYMKVTVLGHRKMLLKGVEQLNVATNGVPPPPVPPTVTKASSGVGTSDGNEENVTPTGTATDPKKIHWSHVEPISERKVSGGPVPVNLADGEYDEAKAHADFTAAVMAWRRGDVATEAPAAEPGMWRNPLAGPESERPATADCSTGADAEAGPASGGALLEGDVDEEDEHRKFRAAVAAWREESTGSTEKASCFQCYKLFFKEAGGDGGFMEGSKDFCTAECRQTHVDGVAAAKERAEARIAERKRAAEEAARFADEAAAKRAAGLAEDEDAEEGEGEGVDETEAGDAAESRDDAAVADEPGEPPLSARMDEIWATPINF